METNGDTLNVQLTFVEPLLATMPGDKEIASEFVLSKHPEHLQADEAKALESLSEVIEKSKTVF